MTDKVEVAHSSTGQVVQMSQCQEARESTLPSGNELCANQRPKYKKAKEERL